MKVRRWPIERQIAIRESLISTIQATSEHV